MSPDDAAAIRAVHAPYYRAFKAACHAAHRDFRRVLRRSLTALVDQGYAPGDISTMCGLTRQRIEQCMTEFGIVASWPENGSQLRLWDHELARFRPLTAAEFQDVMRRRRPRSAEEEARRVERRAMVQTVRALRTTLGRDPTTAEVVTAVGRPGTYIARLWTPVAARGRVRPHRHWRGWNRLRRLAGCAVWTDSRVPQAPYLSGRPREDARRAERRAMVRTVQALRTALHRDPTSLEVTTAVGRSAGYIGKLWMPVVGGGGARRVRPHQHWRGWNRLRRLAGCAAGRRGIRTQCAKGHPRDGGRCLICAREGAARLSRRRTQERPWAAEGAVVQRLREAAGLSRRTVATCLGVGYSRVWAWEEAGMSAIPARYWLRMTMLLALPPAVVVRCFPQAFDDAVE